MNKAICALSITSALIFALSVDLVKADECGALVNHDITKKTEWHQSNYGKLVFLSKLATSEWSEVSDAFAHEGNISVGPIKVGPATWNKDRHESLKKEMSSFVDVEQIMKNQSSLLMSSGDPATLGAITDCYKLHGGLLVGSQPAGKNYLTLELTWTPFPGQPNLDPALSSDIQVINGSVVGSNDYAKQGTHIGIRLTRTIAISREAQKDLIVIVNTREGGSGSLYLPVASFPDAKVCKIVYGTPLTKPGVQSEDLEVAFNSTKYDCADLGRKNGATDVRLGCDGSTGKRFADQQFCILGNACATPPGTQGGQGPFAPHPGCGW